MLPRPTGRPSPVTLGLVPDISGVSVTADEITETGETMDDDLATAIGAAAPALDEVQLTGVARAVAAQLADRPARITSLNRRRWRRTSLLVGLALTVPVGAAAAAVWKAHTGTFGNPATTEEDGSEWLNVCAPDFAAAVRAEAPTDLPLPPGRTLDQIAVMVTQQPGSNPACAGGSALRQVTGVKSEYLFAATCLWQRDGLAAQASGDAARRARAADAIRRIAAHPVLHAVDGGGLVARQQQLADQLAAGTAERATQLLNCSDEWT